MIYLTRHQDIGALLRHLRHRAGLTLDQTAHRAQLSASGIHKREARNNATLATLVDHAQALGCRVAIVPADRRETGTGWPA